jgi:WD40 repeat protein
MEGAPTDDKNIPMQKQPAKVDGALLTAARAILRSGVQIGAKKLTKQIKAKHPELVQNGIKYGVKEVRDVLVELENEARAACDWGTVVAAMSIAASIESDRLLSVFARVCTKWRAAARTEPGFRLRYMEAHRCPTTVDAGGERVAGLGRLTTVWSMEALLPEEGQDARFASGGEDGTICIWSATGDLLRVLPAQPVQPVQYTSQLADQLAGLHTSPGTAMCDVMSLHSLPGGLLVAGLRSSGMNMGRITIWQVTTGNLLHTIQAHGDGVNALTSFVYAQDGQPARTLLASASREVKVWEPESGEHLCTFDGHAIENYQGPGAGEFLQNVLAQYGGPVNDHSMCPLMALASIPPLSSRATTALPQAANCLIASGAIDGSIIVRDLQAIVIFRKPKAHKHAIYAVKPVAGNSALASCSGDGTVKVWSLQTGNLLRKLSSSPAKIIWDLAVLPDGSLAIAAGQCTHSQGREQCTRSNCDQTGTVEIWNVQSGLKLRSVATSRASFESLTVVPSDEGGAVLAGGLSGGHVRGSQKGSEAGGIVLFRGLGMDKLSRDQVTESITAADLECKQKAEADRTKKAEANRKKKKRQKERKEQERQAREEEQNPTEVANAQPEPEPELDHQTQQLSALIKQGVQQWSASQVLEWVGLIDLPLENVAAATAAFELLDLDDGEELLELGPRMLQKQLRRSGEPDAEALAQLLLGARDALLMDDTTTQDDAGVAAQTTAESRQVLQQVQQKDSDATIVELSGALSTQLC